MRFAALLPKSRLGRELVLVLFLKALIISLAAIFIFGPHQRPRIDADKVAARLFGSATPTLSGLPSRSQSP